MRIVDPLGRWETRVRLPTPDAVFRSSMDHPAVIKDALPGYVHIRIDDGRSGINCFVYEEPILAGEALDKMLRAIAPGLEFVGFSPLSIAHINSVPLVETTLRYRTTGEPISDGKMKMVLFPRDQTPVVCTREWQDGPSPNDRIIREFVQHITGIDDGADSRALFRFEKDDRHLGFATLATQSIGDDSVATLRSSWFDFSKDGAKNRDRVLREATRADGTLVWTQWFEIFDGEISVRGQVERQGDEYRYALDHRGEQSSGTFITEASLSGWLHGFLSGQVPADESPGLVFHPFVHPMGSTRCEKTRFEGTGSGDSSCVTCRPYPNAPTTWSGPNFSSFRFSISAHDSRTESILFVPTCVANDEPARDARFSLPEIGSHARLLHRDVPNVVQSGD